MSPQGHEAVADRIARRARREALPERERRRRTRLPRALRAESQRTVYTTFMTLLVGAVLLPMADLPAAAFALAFMSTAHALVLVPRIREKLLSGRRRFFHHLPVTSGEAFDANLAFVLGPTRFWLAGLLAITLPAVLRADLEPLWALLWMAVTVVLWCATPCLAGLLLAVKPKWTLTLEAVGLGLQLLVPVVAATDVAFRHGAPWRETWVDGWPLLLTPFGWASKGLSEATRGESLLWLVLLLPAAVLSALWPPFRTELRRALARADTPISPTPRSAPVPSRSEGLARAESGVISSAAGRWSQGRRASADRLSLSLCPGDPISESTTLVARVAGAWWTQEERRVALVLRADVRRAATMTATASGLFLLGAILAWLWSSAPLWVHVVPGVAAALVGLPFLCVLVWPALEPCRIGRREASWCALLPIRLRTAWSASLKLVTIQAALVAPFAVVYTGAVVRAAGGDPFGATFLLGALKGGVLALGFLNPLVFSFTAGWGRAPSWKKVLPDLAVLTALLGGVALAVATWILGDPLSWGALAGACVLGWGTLLAAGAAEPRRDQLFDAREVA